MLSLLFAFLLQQGYDQLAPWSAVRWADEKPQVEVDARWYELASIDATEAADLVAFCKNTWPDKWRKRFEEDLVEALTRMGHAPGAKVKLALIDLQTRQRVTRENVAMTEENRQKILKAAKERGKEMPALAPARSGDEYDKLAPYAAIRWRPEVEVDGKWFTLTAIDGTSVDEILAFCQRTWPNKWLKRFEEDLVEALTLMGKKPAEKVALDLVDLATGRKEARRGVPMTAENRWAIWQAAQQRDNGRDVPLPPPPAPKKDDTANGHEPAPAALAPTVPVVAPGIVRARRERPER